MPEEYVWSVPPEVPTDYMARGKEIWYRAIESYKKYKCLAYDRNRG